MSIDEHPPDWYRDWFGQEYLALYPHRDEEEARAGVDLVLRVSGRPAGPVLDLACGAGRHMVVMRQVGLDPVGLDLSDSLLGEARKLEPRLRLVRGDMRHLPFADGSFDLVANFFTSFGYFEQPEEDRLVLGEIRRVLQAGGHFALDFLNAQRVRDSLIPRDERVLGERRVVQERRLLDGGTVVAKEIRIYDPGATTPTSTYYERVRLYSAEELVVMLREAGLGVTHAFGDYEGTSPGPHRPRHILLGHAL
jgi:SAM-dependent methyltransferase